MPVWTSSKTSAAPTSSHAARIDGQQLRRHDVHARLALDRLDQHRGGVGVDGGGDLGRVDGAEPRHQRRERRLLGLLRRGAQRAVGAAVERVQRDDHVAARAVLAHELDRRLVGLGARVAEEHAAAQRPRGEPVRQPHVRLGGEQVRDVDQPPDLLLHGRDHARMAVAEVVDRDPAQEVEVLDRPSQSVSQHPGTGDELDRVARVGVREAHEAGLTFVPMPASVNSSSSSECGSRPSMMCA